MSLWFPVVNSVVVYEASSQVTFKPRRLRWLIHMTILNMKTSQNSCWNIWNLPSVTVRDSRYIQDAFTQHSFWLKTENFLCLLAIHLHNNSVLVGWELLQTGFKVFFFSNIYFSLCKLQKMHICENSDINTHIFHVQSIAVILKSGSRDPLPCRVQL